MTPHKIQFIPGLGERKKDYAGRLEFCDIYDIDWNEPEIKLKRAPVLAGFSFGAVEAINSAHKLKTKILILCSTTPVAFDINSVNVPHIIFIEGEKEDSSQARKLYKAFNGKKQFIIVKGARHYVNKKYQTVLRKLSEELCVE